jgi:hypothetical protein
MDEVFELERDGFTVCRNILSEEEQNEVLASVFIARAVVRGGSLHTVDFGASTFGTIAAPSSALFS